MNVQKWITMILVSFLGSAAFALKDFSELPGCGSAKVVSGTTCSNVKVEIDFTGCQMKSAPQIANRVVCEGTNIKARFQDENFRYEAQFAKADDSWGGVAWKPLGAMKQWKKISLAHVEKSVGKTAASAPAVEAARAVTAEPTPTTTTPAIKFGAFFDLRYTRLDQDSKDPNPVNDSAESGFAIEDGALYANYENGKVSVIGDLAFRRKKDSESNPSATVPNQSNNADLAVATSPSQLYVKYKALDSLNVYAGQFDTIYGVELNDSKDRVFGKTGLVYDNQLPVTHTGVMLEYSTHGAVLKAFAANPNNRGTTGTSGVYDDNTEYGTAVGYSNDTYRGQIGYMSRPLRKAGSTDRGDRSLLDVIAGATFGSFLVDVEYTSVDDPSKDGLTATANDDEDPATGVLVLAQYKFSDRLMLGVRYETMADLLAGTTALDKVDSWGLSVRSKLTSEIEARAEYITYSYDPMAAGDKWDNSRLNLSGVITF